MLDKVFSMLYGYNAKNEKELLETTFYAFDDFVHRVRGKAADYKIKNLENAPTPLDKVVRNAKNIHIILDDINDIDNDKEKLWIVHRMICEIRRLNTDIQFNLSYKNIDIDINPLQSVLEKLDSEVEIPAIHKGDKNIQYDVVFEQCNHVSEVKENILPIVYIDRYCNCITNMDEYIYFVGTEQAKDFFKNTYRPIMYKVISEIRTNK
jgi:hypothetical protein